MSIKVKLQAFKVECFSDLDKREKELLNLKKNIDYLIEQYRKEILVESDRLENKQRILENKEKKHSESITKRERELELYANSIENRIDGHIKEVIGYFEFLGNYGKEPKIIEAYINACYGLDEKLAKYFLHRTRPNINASETIRAYKREARKNAQRIKELEYQLSELWAKDIDTSNKEEFEEIESDEERVKHFLLSREYSILNETQRNQKALDNYLHKKHSKAHIGKMYERYIGYIYEQKGYKVEYRGIEMGLKDGGIDLICRKRGEILLVQCKNWSLDSTIYEKHICQLYGASKFYDKDSIQAEYSDGLFANIEWDRVTPVFVSTSNLDHHALEVANKLGVKTMQIPYNRKYPIIKCNINNSGEKIYHLPFDQKYDLTKISKKGECWVSTVREAEELGFRRAHRHYIEE